MGTRVVYKSPATGAAYQTSTISWDGCIPITVKAGSPARIVSDVVISFSVPGGGSNTDVYQKVKHKTYLMGILPKDEVPTPPHSNSDSQADRSRQD
jgi:hypothetical protein